MTIGRLFAYLQEAFGAIWRNRTRSLLTMLGMIIGTSSIIAVLGVSKAASSGITSTLNSFGDPGITIAVDPNQDDPVSAAIQFRDVRTIASALGPMLSYVEPSYERTFKLRWHGHTTSTNVASASPHSQFTFTMREGRRMDETDVASAAHVCLLTSELSQKLFKDVSPIGQVVDMGSIRCTVVGEYGEVKSSLFSSIGASDFALIPYTTFRQIAPGPIDSLTVYAAPGVAVPDVSDAVDRVLQRLHGPRATYITQDTTAQLGTFSTVLSVIGVGLSAIGGVSLLVAGIGIMNIMLVSVTERTREIGLRKAIGARRGDVALQFLLEAILLSLIGGGIGMSLGFLATLGGYTAIRSIVGEAPIPWLLIMSIAIGFSMVVGCVFGTYPAIRASRMDPIAALRT
ncbi:MAG TPA: ABC transporter permease [Candidatus Elarobacter sp.]|nr:ABC transporter permease [Candidatus Elarobacter sp.]